MRISRRFFAPHSFFTFAAKPSAAWLYGYISPALIHDLILPDNCDLNSLEEFIRYQQKKGGREIQITALINNAPEPHQDSFRFTPTREQYIHDVLGSCEWREKTCLALDLSADKLGGEFFWVRNALISMEIIGLVRNHDYEVQAAA